jgi:hypothetical protein
MLATIWKPATKGTLENIMEVFNITGRQQPLGIPETLKKLTIGNAMLATESIYIPEETGSTIDGGRCRKTGKQEYHLRYMQKDAGREAYQ